MCSLKKILVLLEVHVVTHNTSDSKPIPNLFFKLCIYYNNNFFQKMCEVFKLLQL